MFFGPSTLVELLRHRARFQAKDTAFTILVDGENDKFDLTYEELDRQARAIAAWLQSQNLVGQRALLLYPPGAEFITAFFGCLYSGVVAVPVYPPRRNRSLSRIQTVADDADAKVALTTDSVLQRVEPLIDETPHLKQLTWLATCHVPEGIERHWQNPEVNGGTLAFLQYTSGSTGSPKGVMLNHANLVHNSALIAYAFEHTRSGSGVFWLPSYHDMGLIGGILQPLYVGRPNVLMSPMSFLQKPFRWLSAISRFRCTTSGGPNFAYDLCVRKITPEQKKMLDLSCWKVAFNGAEPIRAETLQAFTEAFEPCGFRPEAFYPCYGLAEATLIASGGLAPDPPVIKTFDSTALTEDRVVECRPDAENARKLVGSGQNMPDQKIAIADPDTLTSCPADRIGEIWVGGPSIAQGYWRQPEATRAIFQAHLKDTGQGPFLRTGDLGFLHDGELYVTGRIKDLLIIHGVNHYPQDIEYSMQQSHERLRNDSGAAFTVERDGKEELVLVQEIERGDNADLSGIFSTILQAVALEHDLHPQAIVLLKPTSIPKTSSGKVQRHACRDGFLGGTLAEVGRWSAADSRIAPKTAAPAACVCSPERATATTAATNPKAATAASAAGQLAAAAGAHPTHRPPPSGNGPRIAVRKHTLDLVLEEIRRIARQRADVLTLDTPIVETGLDSLERMEILSTLEERFGGRFPEEILPELETTRQLAAAVEKYLGFEPRPIAQPPGVLEVSESDFRFELFPEYLQLKQSLDLLDASGLGNPYFSVHEGITSDRAVIGGRELINFCSYNYLGMSGNPDVSKAAKEAIDRYGTSTSASRLVSGEKTIHGELERAIAGFLGVEACLSMVGGHSTNETVIGHLLGPGDLILHDGLAHNSIVQGAILSGARRRPFRHNDWEAADRVLEQYRHEYRRVLIVIEGAYSMDGDYPNLPEFIRVKKRHKALMMIDEAHSMLVLGPTGRGIGELYNVDRRDVDIWMGTFSKAFGSCGGYIGGCKALIEYLKYTTPGFVFAASIPPSAAAAALTALRLVEAHPEWPARARSNAALFLALAREKGMNTGPSQDTAVVPVIIGNSMDCLRLSRAMFDRGVNVAPILHPAVEEKASRLRFFITTLHNEQQIRYTVQTMAEELEKIDPKYLGK
jgi:7-keto-8-aminopelargonate synthetase-like enzyme/acyl-CoA synthetase (AMP-forming)/AMP-acid ligase II/acyl carrier protein